MKTKKVNQPEPLDTVRSKIMWGTGFRIDNGADSASLNLVADNIAELRKMHRALKAAGIFYAPFKPESCGRYVVVELPKEPKR